MRHSDAYDEFERAYSYPIDRQTVIETMGEQTIESPNGGGKTIAEIMDHAESETYDSPRALYEEFLSCLGDQYIGRKFYDDRGDNVGTMEWQ